MTRIKKRTRTIRKKSWGKELLERGYSSLNFNDRHLSLASKISFDRGIANGVHKVLMVLVSDIRTLSHGYGW